MRMTTVCKNGILLAKVWDASNYFLRLRGLIGRELSEGGGLLLTPCDQVHTCFMGYPIDIVYLDAAGAVLRIDAAVPPGRLLSRAKGARGVLELPAFAAGALSAGDILEVGSWRKERLTRLRN